MSSQGDLASATLAGASAEAESVGRYLSRQRRMRGISIEELSQLTRIPLRSLERLESGSFDREADGFVRGFVRTVSVALGLDPDDTVARMLSEVRVVDEGPSQTVVSLRWGVAVVAVLLLGVGVVSAVQSLLASDAPAPPEARSETVFRRDPVRALAEATASVAPRNETAAGDAGSEREGRTARAPR